MNTPTKPNQMTVPGAPMKMVDPRTPMTTNTTDAPGAPEKKTFVQSASDAASDTYKSVTANLFGSDQDGGKKRKSMKKSRKSRKSMKKSRKGKKGGNPKKGMASKTRKGKKDYVTHKGDKYYNRKGKRQTMSRKGRKGTPYSKRR